jgi:hypothetical protein
MTLAAEDHSLADVTLAQHVFGDVRTAGAPLLD